MSETKKGFTLTALITKIDDEKREVWGVATTEEVDQQNEIVDFAASVAAFDEWTKRFQSATKGQSSGNVREMHQPLPVGKVIAWEPDYETKKIRVGVKISKAAADTWQKIKDGVLTGFSIGAHYAERAISFVDGKSVNRVTKYLLSELSLVDNPACPGATIELVKGGTEVFGLEEIEKGAPQSTEIQTLIFSKDKFRRKGAKRWAASHGFSSHNVDETEDSYRLRQKEPGEFKDGTFRTIELTSGVSAVIGKPKSKEAAAKITGDTLTDVPTRSPNPTNETSTDNTNLPKPQQPKGKEKDFQNDFQGNDPYDPNMPPMAREIANKITALKAELDKLLKGENMKPKAKFCATCGKEMAGKEADDSGYSHKECAMKEAADQLADSATPQSPSMGTPKHPAMEEPISVKMQAEIDALKKSNEALSEQVKKIAAQPAGNTNAPAKPVVDATKSPDNTDPLAALNAKTDSLLNNLEEMRKSAVIDALEYHVIATNAAKLAVLEANMNPKNFIAQIGKGLVGHGVNKGA